jgi:hypothetical protein
MIPLAELMPTAVTTILPVPSITCVPMEDKSTSFHGEARAIYRQHAPAGFSKYIATKQQLSPKALH